MPSDDDNSGHITTLEWIVEGHILLVNLKIKAVEDAMVYDQMIVDRMNSTPHKMDLIVRMPDFASQNCPSLKQLTSFKYQRHPRLGYVIFIGQKTNRLVRLLITTVASVRKLKTQTYETLDEAVAFLIQTRNLGI